MIKNNGYSVKVWRNEEEEGEAMAEWRWIGYRDRWRPPDKRHNALNCLISEMDRKQ